MKIQITAFAFTMLGFSAAHAQLANGSTAPDFTLTDIDGNTQHLYDYLDAGKTVYLDFFAAHCPTCWGYKNAGHLSNLYATYGPSGSDEIVVIAIELDANNGYNELHGISGVTQGDWVTPTPYPIINPEGVERSSVISSFAANFYPLIYGICPDKTVKVVGTVSTAALYDYHTSECSSLGVSEVQEQPFFTAKTDSVCVLEEGYLSITDVSGRSVAFGHPVTSGSVISISDYPSGMYIFSLEAKGTVQTLKLLRP